MRQNDFTAKILQILLFHTEHKTDNNINIKFLLTEGLQILQLAVLMIYSDKGVLRILERLQ